jgi:hypothetical protein
MSDDAPKIQIDADWKSQAQAEKQRLEELEHQKAAEPGAKRGEGGPGEMPPANWETLVSMMATQALLYMGGYVDPRTNRAMVDLDAARHQIDLLGVLEEKTKGNLDEEEAKQLATILYELRMQYVRIAQAAMSQMSERGGKGGGGQGKTGPVIKAP